jgi:hypothetical protein
MDDESKIDEPEGCTTTNPALTKSSLSGNDSMAIADLTAEVLRAHFTYHPETGDFIRLGESRPSGRIATQGYRQIAFHGRRYMAHRLAWLYVHGEWPADQIDHINQNKDDNRIENLRVVNCKQNAENITMFKHNTSGRRGVCWKEKTGRWQADIRNHKRSIYLGSFMTIIDAVAARMRAERELFTHAPITQNFTQDPETPRPSMISMLAPGTKKA